MPFKLRKKIINFLKRKFIKEKEYLYPAAKASTQEELKNYKYKAWTAENVGEIYEGNVEKNFFSSVTLKHFLKYIKPTDKVLDVGAGTGRLTLPLAEAGCEVVAIDISKEILKVIEGKKGDKKITTVVSNCEKLPFENSSFDSVVSLDAMIHFPNWQEFLSEQARVVKNGGIIAFNIYSGDNFNNIENDRVKASNYITNGDFYANATETEITDACKKFNLEIVKLQPYNFLYQNSFSYGNLTSAEQVQFNTLYSKMLNSPKVLEIIEQFEEKIVSKLSHKDCSNMLVVLRKKQ